MNTNQKGIETHTARSDPHHPSAWSPRGVAVKKKEGIWCNLNIPELTVNQYFVTIGYFWLSPALLKIRDVIERNPVTGYVITTRQEEERGDGIFIP